MNLKSSLLILGVLLAVMIIRCPSARVDQKNLMNYLETIEDNKDNDFDDEDELAEVAFDDDDVNYDDMDRVFDPKAWGRFRFRLPRIPIRIPRIPIRLPRIPIRLPRIPIRSPRIPIRLPRIPIPSIRITGWARKWGKK